MPRCDLHLNASLLSVFRPDARPGLVSDANPLHQHDRVLSVSKNLIPRRRILARSFFFSPSTPALCFLSRRHGKIAVTTIAVGDSRRVMSLRAMSRQFPRWGKDVFLVDLRDSNERFECVARPIRFRSVGEINRANSITSERWEPLMNFPDE